MRLHFPCTNGLAKDLDRPDDKSAISRRAQLLLVLFANVNFAASRSQHLVWEHIHWLEFLQCRGELNMVNTYAMGLHVSEAAPVFREVYQNAG